MESETVNMITVERANAYFATRTVGQVWNEYALEQKEAAIAQAKRDLAKAIHRPIKTDEPEYVEGEEKRDEYAVYEQAFFALVRDCPPMGDGDVVPSLDPDTKKPVFQTVNVGNCAFSIEALKWLCNKLSVVTKLA